MSEFEIYRGGTSLKMSDYLGGEMWVEMDGNKQPCSVFVTLPRPEVLQLRDWLNRWLEETPP